MLHLLECHKTPPPSLPNHNLWNHLQKGTQDTTVADGSLTRTSIMNFQYWYHFQLFCHHKCMLLILKYSWVYLGIKQVHGHNPSKIWQRIIVLYYLHETQPDELQLAKGNQLVKLNSSAPRKNQTIIYYWSELDLNMKYMHKNQWPNLWTMPKHSVFY